MSSSMTPEQWDAIKNSPAMQPPAGVQPNSADPVNQNQPFLIVSSLLLGIMAVFIMNRAYSKLWITRRYSWDDCESCMVPCVSASGGNLLTLATIVTIILAVVGICRCALLALKRVSNDVIAMQIGSVAYYVACVWGTLYGRHMYC